MKELTSVELAVLVKEFQILINARIDKIFQPQPRQILVTMHKTGVGKQILKLEAGKYAYITEKKATTELPPGFCMFLRKKLANARITNIEQKGFERIFEIGFSTKDANYKLIVELFSKGNIILCDSEDIIISALERQHISGRDVKKGEKYEYPKKEFDLLKFDAKELLEKTTKKEIVKVLAVDLGMGGKYAEEALLKAGVDKKTDPSELKPKQIENLKKATDEIKKSVKRPKPAIVGKEVIPFDMELYSGKEKIMKDTLSSAFDELAVDEAIVESVKDKKIKKLQEIIDRQRKQIAKMHDEEELNTLKGEMIYENYAVIEEILKEINSAKKKFSIKEIKERIKGHKVVKDVNKDGTVVVELK